jgi:predicted nuclease of restriction endonuclease-like (RecB) superfamily
MSKSKRKPASTKPASENQPDALFGRVVSILEQARGNVVRAVNTQMVLAYWLIGREIVQELQGGKARANYGERVVEDLSARLTERFGKGFSTRNVKLFKQFYLTWHKTSLIGHPLVAQSSVPEIGQPPVAQSSPLEKLQPPSLERPPAISPQLTWSHYIALMRVNELEARDFYEREAVAGGWDKRTLERQIHTQYYHRCRHSQQPGKLIADGRRLQKTQPDHGELLKNPYVLEFLGYPNFAELRESDVEQAIITHLQRFLLELGSGFAFVARQKHIRIEDEDRFIDLVFYHCRLKFYLLIDLKINKVTHEDVGQMDGYVRMYDGLFTAPDDNPTIGLILCTEKNETVARYSVLNDRKQIFASKYMLCLPTEEQLRQEIERERRMIENTLLPDE